jgi:hypothetical protein
MGKAATKPKAAPEGMMWDGKHLIEKGLGTWHIHYNEDGSVKGAIFCSYPVVVPELTHEQEQAIKARKRKRRR